MFVYQFFSDYSKDKLYDTMNLMVSHGPLAYSYRTDEIYILVVQHNLDFPPYFSVWITGTGHPGCLPSQQP